MKKGNRLVIRAALWLHEQYQRRQREECASNRAAGLNVTIRPYLARALDSERLLHKAQSLGFSGAAESVRRRCIRARDDLAGTLDWYIRQKREEEEDVRIPSFANLTAELLGCEEEFGTLEVSRSERRISVQTERIVLEGIPLGCFRIDFLPEALHAGTLVNWFRVEALESNPSASDCHVPHPHVSRTLLCTGDGTSAARTALEHGRICDFFVLIRSILETYNPDSAYVILEEWNGVPCHDCGYVTNADCAFYCEECEQTYCDECISSCAVCDTILCLSCLHRSEFSDDWVCASCSSPCESCGRRCENEQLADGFCPDCHETEEEQDPMEEASHEEQTESTHQNQQQGEAAAATPAVVVE